MIVVVDNYDSFTYNLVQLFEVRTKELLRVVRNDAFEVDELLAERPRAIVISPGPGVPSRAGRSVELVRRAGDVPLLGVCLGHQAVGEAFGARVVRAPLPVHGKTSPISHSGARLFDGCPNAIRVARYHSLVIERQTMPSELLVEAESDDGLVMAVRHATRPVHGVQFHPESFGSEHGATLAWNFLRLAGIE